VSTVREQILNILKSRGQATVSDMSTALDLAPVSVRHHLDMLLRQEVIRTDGVQRRPTRGRPRHIYVLTEAAQRFFPNRYEELARELLREMKHSLPSEHVAAFFQRLATDAAGALPMSPELDAEQRLALAARYLSEKGYLATWEHRDNGTYLLHVSNCPFEGLPAEHNELCEMDMRLISMLLQRDACRIAHAAGGDHRCSYLIS
jgi:predicted ArsR family transcriptional regulator